MLPENFLRVITGLLVNFKSVIVKVNVTIFCIIISCLWFEKESLVAQTIAFSQKNNTENSEEKIEVIFSVDPKNNGINDVFLKEQDMEAQLYKLKATCYRCEFYEGTVEGSFTEKDSRIRPGKQATLTIHTMQNLMPGKVFVPGKFPPGSRFTMARTKTKVIENQKGSFRVKTY